MLSVISQKNLYRDEEFCAGFLYSLARVEISVMAS